MATAEEYAKWIVENQDKKGTPEFDTVAKAYQLARGQQQPEAQPIQPKAPEIPDWQRAALVGTRGFLQGGALGLATAMAGESQRQLDKGAYKAGGAVTDVTGSPALGYATNVAIQAIPTILGGEVAKGVMSPGLKAAARSTMQSALKPSVKALKTGKASEAITTMLDEGVNVTPGGVAKLRGQISKLNEEIAERIANSPATVDKMRVGQELNKLVQKFQKQVTPGSDVNAIRKAWQEFLNHPLIKTDLRSMMAAGRGPNEIPVQLAQELKQGTYKVLEGKYGELGSAATEAQKTLARGLKEGIAEQIPEIAKLNAKESRLLNALILAERRAGLQGNVNIGGLAWLASNPAAAAAFMADRSSLFKSIVARMLNANARTVPQVIGSGGAAIYEANTQNQ